MDAHREVESNASVPSGGAPIADRPATPAATPPAPTGPRVLLSLANTGVFYRDRVDGTRGTIVVSELSASYEVVPSWRLYAREAFAHNDASTNLGPTGSAFANPGLGVRHVVPLGDHVALAPRAEVLVPVGSGGGDSPDPGARSASYVATLVTTAFSPNYLTTTPAVGVLVRAGPFSGELREAALLGFRVRGERVDSVPFSTRLATSASASYAVVRDRFGVNAFLYYGYTPTMPDPTRRDFWYASAGPSLTVAFVTLSVNYGRVLNPPVTRYEPQFVDVIFDAAF